MVNWPLPIKYLRGDEMCLAVPAQIIYMQGAFAEVDMMGFRSKVYIELIKDPCIGDFVLVHAGCAIERIDQEALTDYQEFWQELGAGVNV